jgi:hypothetical protein
MSDVVEFSEHENGKQIDLHWQQIIRVTLRGAHYGLSLASSAFKTTCAVVGDRRTDSSINETWMSRNPSRGLPRRRAWDN